MRTIPEINISDYDYPLPDARIAMHPLANRDDSKLLVYRDNQIIDSRFSSLSEYLPPDSLMVLNNTRVIHARLLFHKSTGASIEIFCLEPQAPISDIQLAMQQKNGCVWKCLVGNAKKWKSGLLSHSFKMDSHTLNLSAEIIEKHGETFLIRFSWGPGHLSFAQIIETTGKVPLPPYIHRDADEADTIRYQTVFASSDGSVAAPTAGLHFTENVFASLIKKNISTAYLTLHVGAGTFKPVSTENVKQHVMHAEQVVVSKELITSLLHNENQIIAVGTTSVRTLESLYWMGVKYLASGLMSSEVNQWDAYETDYKTPATREVLQSIIAYLQQNKLNQLHFSTSMIIIPGYKFRIIKGMITNFHQPKSTLLLLISAFLGEKWNEIYDHALQNNYRFLSYGDACLFLR